jgi:starch phosphorylase
MEMGLVSNMPTYSGGLGVLAGDVIRCAADMKVPMVGVTLLARKGYFHQALDAAGGQTETPEEWRIEDFLTRESATAQVVVDGRRVNLAAWRRDVTGCGGYVVPVYFLDADLPENAEADRRLTDCLYGGDAGYRLCQEILLGIGGVRMLRALGYTGLERYHMNEGHAAFLGLELLDEHAAAAGRATVTRDDLDSVRKKCVFTTHTPVAAGTDKFEMQLVGRVLGQHEVLEMEDLYAFENVLNMTYLALNLSHYVNGVAKKHGEISSLLFGGYRIDSITNGVHAATWAAPSFVELFDRHIPGWHEDNFSLRYALRLPAEDVRGAHARAKRDLIAEVNRQTGAEMDEATLTLGFARRATAYKRADLLFHDLDRLRRIASGAGALQVVYAGKAHPADTPGKELIRRIFEARDALQREIRVAYLPNYDMDLGRLMTSGSDVWLNTPQPPNEASGTSGMKAAVNGVPSLSVLDGWWIEGCVEGRTGWAIGADGRGAGPEGDPAADAAALYDKLETVIVPTFYRDRGRFTDIMLHAIALNGSFFNAQRMLQQYVLKAYFE